MIVYSRDNLIKGANGSSSRKTPRSQTGSLIVEESEGGGSYNKTARILALTHMAKDCFEDVCRLVEIIVTMCVISQTSMGNTVPLSQRSFFQYLLPFTSAILCCISAQTLPPATTCSYYSLYQV